MTCYIQTDALPKLAGEQSFETGRDRIELS
jgi:hypothetical protein